MEILIFLVVSYILFSISLMKVFEKAGEPGWKGLVPGMNFIVMCKLVGRKSAHAAWLLVPIVNIFIFVGLCVDLVRSFGKYKFHHSALAVIYAPAIFFYLGYSPKEKYLGRTLEAEQAYREKLEEARNGKNARLFQKLERENPYKKSPTREWTEAIIFAVFAAAFIRMFLIEAYTIPTSSMEGSLKVGDFLFVSKAHYGIRTPKTVLMLPLLHNRVPVIGGESYISEPNLPFYRLPALTEVKRYDPVVFNYPEGDSVFVFPERTWSIHDFRRGSTSQERYVEIKNGQAELVVRPIDKKDHYIKRCIGLPGDSLKIVNRQVFINGAPAENPTRMQFLYEISSESGAITVAGMNEAGANVTEALVLAGIFPMEDMAVQNLNRIFGNAIELKPAEGQSSSVYKVTFLRNSYSTSQLKELGMDVDKGKIVIGAAFLDNESAEKIKGFGPDVKVEFYQQQPPPPGHLFPHDPVNFPAWTVDNFGPVWIPKKGETVEISSKNIALYERIIGVYEGNKLEKRGEQIFINGQPAASYTFKMNYFWMMGDNRHNSEDARVWGFVPEDHIVGKPLFIWFSTKNGNMGNGINWNRLFTSANKM